MSRKALKTKNHWRVREKLHEILRNINPSRSGILALRSKLEQQLSTNESVYFHLTINGVGQASLILSNNPSIIELAQNCSEILWPTSLEKKIKEH